MNSAMLLTWACQFTLLCLALANAIVLWRLIKGPTPQDRVWAMDSLSVNTMLMVLTLGLLFRTAWYFDIALLMALFGFVSTAAAAKFLLRGEAIEP